MYVLVTIGSGVRFSSYAYLLVIDLSSGRVVEEFKLRHHVYEQSTKGFTGGAVADDGTLWVTTEAEVVKFRVNPLELIKAMSKPFFNDMHHVYYDSLRDTILVCNTGLDAVEIFSTDLKHIESVSLIQHGDYLSQALRVFLIEKPRRKLRNLTIKLRRAMHPPSEAFWAEDMRYKHLTESIFLVDFYKVFLPSRLYRLGVDLRYVLFRPHILHPNFIWRIGDDYLVTLRNTGQVITLEGGKAVLSGLNGPHDGILRDGTYLLTQAGSGMLTYARPVESLNGLSNAAVQHIQVCNPKEGFVRGVDLVTEEKAVVAVSKRREINDDRPAYLSIVDLSNGRCSEAIDIPLIYGTNPFSVVDVTQLYN